MDFLTNQTSMNKESHDSEVRAITELGGNGLRVRSGCKNEDGRSVSIEVECGFERGRESISSWSRGPTTLRYANCLKIGVTPSDVLVIHVLHQNRSLSRMVNGYQVDLPTYTSSLNNLGRRRTKTCHTNTSSYLTFLVFVVI